MTKALEQAIIGYWGERCADFNANCPCCKAWAELDALEGGVTVKPLEWEERHELRHLAMTETYWRAQTAFDWGYRVKKTAGCYAVHGMEGVHTSLSDAKAAAQADYERRVLSALSAPAQRVEEGLPRLENCGTYLAKDNAGQWHYLSHAQTWQGYQGPTTASPAPALHAGVDGGEKPKLPADVVRLVIAAREVAYGDIETLARATDDDFKPLMDELDMAVEAFAARVEWDDDPARECVDGGATDAR